MLVYAPTIITNLENLPADVSRLATKYLSWYHDDAAWTGFWSEYPEGYVDLEKMNLSDVKLGIDITSTSGEIDGMIGTKEICNLPSLAGFLLIDGKVSGNKAVITAFDYIGGKRQDFTKLTLRRDGIIMAVEPIDGIKNFFPREAKIGRHPDNYPAITASLDSDTADDYFRKLCEEKQKIMEKSRKNNGKVRLSIDQLQSFFDSEKELEK